MTKRVAGISVFDGIMTKNTFFHPNLELCAKKSHIPVEIYTKTLYSYIYGNKHHKQQKTLSNALFAGEKSASLKRN